MKNLLAILFILIPIFNFSQNDCSSAIQLCDNDTYFGTSSGIGVQELNVVNSGCLSIEHQSVWYVFTIQQAGDLSFLIAPDNSSDYDFALWGPNSFCPPLFDPIRCSWAANTGLSSGLNYPATDFTEGATGDGFVAPLFVNVGETYILLIDNFSANFDTYTVDFKESAAVIGCDVLPVELISFEGYYQEGVNILKWVTLTEINNDYFMLETSIDNYNWKFLGAIEGKGNYFETWNYYYIDNEFVENTTNYYRLFQVDFDGTQEDCGTIAINSKLRKPTYNTYINYIGQQTNNYNYTIQFK